MTARCFRHGTRTARLARNTPWFDFDFDWIAL
jgi:hypothetical protein